MWFHNRPKRRKKNLVNFWFFVWTCFHGCARRATESVIGSQVLWSARCGTQAVVVRQSAATTSHVNRARRTPVAFIVDVTRDGRMPHVCVWVVVHASRKRERVWPLRSLCSSRCVYIRICSRRYWRCFDEFTPITVAEQWIRCISLFFWPTLTQRRL